MLIDGVITEKKPVGQYIQLNVCPKIGMHYISAENFILGNSNVYLFVKDLPSFNTVYDYFLSCRVPFLKINKQQDICLSLFYDPYFNEFYKEITKDSKSIPEHRKNFYEKIGFQKNEDDFLTIPCKLF